jgi:hypothetical protein
MRKTYLVLARIIAIEVVIQAMAIAFAFAGVFKWIDDGATLDSSVIDSWDENPPTFQGAIGHFIHVMNGQFLIPLIALILLVVSFFAKVPRGVMFATVLVVAIAIQIVLGLTSHSAPWLAGIHGLNAFIIFGAALEAAKAAKAPDVAPAAPAAAV